MALTRTDLALAALACHAGAVIMAVRARSLASVAKADGSPVTEADRQAEAIILAGLPMIWPGLPVIAEESVAEGRVPSVGKAFILVDPLDGTREFVAGRAEFTVNIARIDCGMPIAGVVFAPASGDCYIASEQGGAWKAKGLPPGQVPVAGDFRPVAARPMRDPPTTVVSLSHFDARTEAHLASRTVGSLRNIGSSLKFCLIAEGEADLYPRFGPTMEWDTAAGDAVLRAAGGFMTQPDGSPFIYGKAGQGFRNGPFIARGAT